MHERFQLPIPFWRMQYQLLGGHRKIWFLAAIYVAVVAIGAIAFQRFMRDEPLSAVCSWIINGLMGIQAFLLLVGGSNSIHRALLRDYQNKMTESHRLTPMSNIGVVLGYVVGANLQILLIFALTVLMGLVVSAIGGKLIGEWFVGNVLLLCAASSLWAMVAFTGLRPAKPVSPAWIIGGVAAFGVPLAMIPGTGLLLNVYTVMLGFWTITGRMKAAEPTAMLVAGVSLTSAFFWLSAAAAKYRRPDLPALNGARGMALLAMWLVLAAGGMIAIDMATKSGLRLPSDAQDIGVQWIGTLLVSILVCATATIGAADCSVLIRSGRQPRGWGDRLSDPLVALLAALVTCGVLAVICQGAWLQIRPPMELESEAFRWSIEAWGATVAAFVLSGFIARGVFRVVRCRFKVKSPLVLTWTLLIVFWALPIADGVRAAAADSSGPLHYTWMSGISPPGTIMMVWTNIDAPLWIGLAVQLGVLLVLTVLGRDRGPKAAALLAPDPKG